MKNVHGKEDTLVTIQIDLLLAKKFGMEYTDSDGIDLGTHVQGVELLLQLVCVVEVRIGDRQNANLHRR